MTGRVVLLATDGVSTRIVFNALERAVGVAAVVIEEPVSRSQLLRRRAQKLGWSRVLGQIAFAMAARPLLAREARVRIETIIDQASLDRTPIPADRVQHVQTVNGDPCRSILAGLSPDVVVINGTRIIGRRTLAAVDVPFINMHAGLTPRYRGVHGAYWAQVEGRPDDAGVTVHRVDEGIDTGEVLAQARIPITGADNFETYPYLQIAAGTPLLVEAVRKALAKTLSSAAPLTDDSRLWSHPTLFEYARGRILRNAR